MALYALRLERPRKAQNQNATKDKMFSIVSHII
jgi:hypothetical protein